MVKTFYELTLLSELPIENVLDRIQKEFSAEIIPKGKSNRWAVIIRGVKSESIAGDGLVEDPAKPTQRADAIEERELK